MARSIGRRRKKHLSRLVSPTAPAPVTEKKPAGRPKKQKFNGTHQKKKAVAEALEATKASAAAAPHLPAVALVPESAALESAALESVPSTPLAAT